MYIYIIYNEIWWFFVENPWISINGLTWDVVAFENPGLDEHLERKVWVNYNDWALGIIGFLQGNHPQIAFIQVSELE